MNQLKNTVNDFNDDFAENIKDLLIEKIDEWENKSIIDKVTANSLRSYEHISWRIEEWQRKGLIDNLTADQLQSYEGSKVVFKKNN